MGTMDSAYHSALEEVGGSRRTFSSKVLLLPDWKPNLYAFVIWSMNIDFEIYAANCERMVVDGVLEDDYFLSVQHLQKS